MVALDVAEVSPLLLRAQTSVKSAATSVCAISCRGVCV